MESKIIRVDQSLNVAQKLTSLGKKIVLAGGCFDIIHIGHLKFLEKAKKQGDVLFIMLESDETVKKTKGINRPINTQADRARVLSALIPVDYVVSLPEFTSDKEYDSLTKSIKPAIIATTKGDRYRFHKERQAKAIGARVVDVIENISNQSTSKIVKLLSRNYE